jgi:uncharacterized protein YyaL (SSP411 family)
MSDTIHKHSNRLIHESSPYLLQHAHNPVDWFPWGKEAIDKAAEEDKLIIVSIGYAACHWCHVMEHESFEDEDVAGVMNAKYMSVKVDREERPDIDQLYMTAVQLMTSRGGWPLNVIVTPEGLPVYGGTYFPKAQWLNILNEVNRLWNEERGRVLEYGKSLAEGIRQTELLKTKEQSLPFYRDDILVAINKWKTRLDQVEGGPNRAPKFPMPVNLSFQLRAGFLMEDAEFLQHLHLTLHKMAMGGIYDQIGGGFARYSTDSFWKVPHFEKMLYDNGQLLSIYAEAYRHKPTQLYKEICLQTTDFLIRELLDTKNGFYSALDADSEGEEGLFYIWEKDEIQAVLNNSDFSFAEVAFSLNEKGLWEHGRYILLKTWSNAELAKHFLISEEEVQQKLKAISQKLMELRNTRIRPATDDKVLCSWNALTIKGLSDVYSSFAYQPALDAALNAADFVWNNMRTSDGKLWHSWKKDVASVEGFLEDYAFLADAFLALYKATWNIEWLLKSKSLLETVIEHFAESGNGLFYFTSNTSEAIVSRLTEVNDNVTPASNSVMASVMIQLAAFFGNMEWHNRAILMLGSVYKEFTNYPEAYGNWGNVALQGIFPPVEIVFTGSEKEEQFNEIYRIYNPLICYGMADKSNQIPLLSGRYDEINNKIYVCKNHVCEQAVSSVKEAFTLLDGVLTRN